ncbi:uncharacterized protein [Misgurnus anguillicaudatus]|uniref:uncharacterized protein n=1 Tax=Misgurnus anguillicaudatus TaxID=75329 RepID=UPI003CCFBB31
MNYLYLYSEWVWPNSEVGGVCFELGGALTACCCCLIWKAIKRCRLVRRRVWVHQILQRRNQLGEFHQLLQELRLDDGRFQRYFRLSRAQFDDLLFRVGERISLQDTNYRHCIPPAERLSICLRYLATGDSYRTIVSSFRVGVSTVCKIVPDVVIATWDCLVDEFMAVPSTDEWRSIAEGFEERWNFPLCCGALDSKHVQIKAPPNTGSQYFNYKGTFSLVLLAVVDARYCFQLIDVGVMGGRDAWMGYYFIRNRITKLIIRPPSICTNVSDQFSNPHPPAIR